MTPKRAAFVREYLVDLNATAAYKRAGYAARGHSAEVEAHKALRNPEIAKAVAAAQQKRAERTGITADRVLQELARIAFFDIRKLYNADGTLKKPTELDDDTAAALVGIDIQETSVGGEDGPIITTRKAKVIERTGALTLAMRHLGMLKDKMELSGELGIADRLKRAEERRK